ncbi:hypothetical protein AQUCO_02600065v1 [Aquilegia coerulea]|uniref:PCI domain-containing protein n=1 Tax=Aquilegia coerulea TaxID=218851 RepID=A0A2G5D755_AQUCA|nr:hypothetical protein AQUCO_02600065v1 [Aquilegia coerulea]
MAFGGFNKNHPGPSFPPRNQTQFGNFPTSTSSSPSPSPPISPFNNNSPSSQRSPRLDTGMGYLFDNAGSGASPQRGGSHPLAMGRNPSNLSYSFEEAQRPSVSPPKWGAYPKSSFGDLNPSKHQEPSSVAPNVNSPNYATSSPARPSNFEDPRRNRTSPYADRDFLDNYAQDVSERVIGAPERMLSPPQAFDSNQNVEALHRPFRESRRWPTETSNFEPPQRTRSPPLQSGNEFTWRKSHPIKSDTDREIISPPIFGNTSAISVNNSNSPIQQRSFLTPPQNEAEGARSKRMNSQVPKRNRSPSLAYSEEHLPGTSYSAQDDTEREMQAKAKRLARFGVELSQPLQKSSDNVKHKSPVNRHDQTLVERHNLVSDQATETAGDSMLFDYEGSESSNVIIGLCPDMCPESERQERERKGDLDKFERLDGDRNQTSRSLAVKKYNRTAEREAHLIRPMPILQQTIDYLLALLDHPYDDQFLGMYNFLWDRMRAIRMDLRMQHIFNEDAITMLEQMIRLHIIAMHELCEYTKGEGFSEGFDAHLNIEQMNKTSVELFQMYDDHRKKGITVMSEKEFRGYYALLKLDKHPGYKVEPAELSLDLAKMTPEIRQTPEILFARDVARACRTGNFIAFFRLARKATYLQACLMHAHFAKLRTQALASLHSGLQSNQGIPISQITKWLGMEEEDIEGLLEYHGFLIKDFKELYMVKEGPFLNSDKDYPTMCSRLVHSKKSTSIVKDVSSSNQLMWPTEESKRIMSGKIVEPSFKAPQLVQSRPSVDAVDEVMATFEEEPSPTDGSHVQPILEKTVSSKRIRSEPQVAEVASVWAFPSPKQSPQSAAAKVAKVGKPARETLHSESMERTLCFNEESVPLKSVPERSQQSDRSEGSLLESWVAIPVPQIIMRPQENDEILTCHQEFKDEEAIIPHQELENEEEMMMAHWDREVAQAKLKLILRKWKRVSLKRKELREQRQLAANAALSLLTLGPPMQQIRAPSSHVRGLDIDRASRERRERHQKSWSRLNVSEVVGGILSERNPDAKCLLWKLIVCSQPNVTEGDRFVQRSQTNHSASLWLHSKIMGVRKDNDDELAVSSPDMSIWKKWVTHQCDRSSICCLSLIREVRFNMLEPTVSGAGAILFLVSESIPLDAQKVQLHNLIMSLPSGSSIPVLILCGSHKEGSLDSLTIVNGLGLHEVDKTRMRSFSVGFLVEDQPHEHFNGFFSTERLRNGLQWLASQSPVQPVVHCIKTRNLIMEQLSSLLGALKSMNASVVGPNHCISAFNEALDRSAAEVATAAETNPSSWPCHEITQLETSNEHGVVESFLPSVGWSSAATVRPILCRIEACKLPYFSDDLSWLNNGTDMGEEILHHKSELERCLIKYLTDTSKMMDKALAATEACVIVQKGALLELQGSKYRIKPKWAEMFRRIFNWRLMNFSSGEDFVVYVLEHRSNIATPPMCGIEEFNNGVGSALQSWDEVELGAYGSLPDSLTQPSLDEMIGVCYNTCQLGWEQTKPEAIQPLSRTNNSGKEALHAANTNGNKEDNKSPRQEVEFTEADDTYLSGDFSRRVVSDYYLSREVVLASNGKKETDNLSKLLEQCNIVQNKIDEKLSIYF